MRGPLPRAFTGISICSFLRKRKERPHRSDWGRFAVMSKSDKQSLRYSDYYWCMSLKDFIEWVEADDDREPATSYSDQR
jgi:hypothetical protein